MDNPVKRKRGRPFGSIVVRPERKTDDRVFIPTEDQKVLSHDDVVDWSSPRTAS